jgi:hypothetical protein
LLTSIENKIEDKNDPAVNESNIPEPQRMRILIAANPLKPKKFESAIFWGLGIACVNRI